MRLAVAFLTLAAVVVVVSDSRGPADGPRVCIEFINGWRSPFHVYLNGTVRDLKETIQRNSYYKVSPSMQIMKYNNQLLDDNRTLEYYHIRRHSLLSLEFAHGYERALTYFFEPTRRPRGEGKKSAMIYVDTEGYSSFEIDVDLTYTVDQLKRRIFEQEEYPIGDQELWFDGNILAGNETLESHGIVSSTTLKLNVPLTWCYMNPSGEPI